MRVVKGDLIALAFDGKFDVIVHGCNCQCTMGAGIAKYIRAAFPEAYEADRRTEKGLRSKLGTISSATIVRDGIKFEVVNAYTQFHYRGRGPKVVYSAIRDAFREVKTRFTDLRIAYPKIGAGLAGGNWSRIAGIIDSELAGERHTLVKLP